jgi:hypothetical protein
MLLPLSDGVWALFFRGMVYGLLAGLFLILFLLLPLGGFAKHYGPLVTARPLGLVYFLAGVEVGIALIGIVVLAGLQALRIHGQHVMNRLKNDSAG